MTLRFLFATPIYEASLSTDRSFENFRAELEAACRMLADEDLAGQAWCKANGYGGYTSYASLDDLPTRASVFGELKTKLDRHAAAFAKDLDFDLGGRRLNYPRGKLLGGSSSINGMIYMRGQAADYDHWRQLGCVGWGWDDVLPIFCSRRTTMAAPATPMARAVR